MVLVLALSTAIELTVGILKYSYSWGRYFIYGHEKTSEEKLDEILKEYHDIHQELIELKKSKIEKDVDSKEIH